MRRAARLPMLILILGLLIAAIVQENTRSTGDVSAVRPDDSMPTARPATAVGSTWYCAAGSATGDASGFAEQTVSIANSSDEAVSGQLTAYTDRGEPVATPVRVAPHSRQNIRISDVVRARWAAALVELSGGEVSVAQLFQGPAGRAAGACASAPAPDWYFPSGSTRNGTRNIMALFNPFPGDATVDITFDTEDGARTPQQFQGLVLVGGRVTVIDIGNVVTLREHVATTVRARTGRIVAQQIQTADGREAAEEGLTVTLGATVTSDVWTFAMATPPESDAHEIVSVMNPGDSDASVEVQIQIDDADEVGSVEPYRLTVLAGRSATVDLMADTRIPRDAGRWIIVRSTTGAEVVAERSIGARRSATSGGLVDTMGVPVVASRWLATFGNPTWASSSVIAVANPSATAEARVTILTHGVGGSKELAGAVDVVIAPGERLVVDLSTVLANRNEASLSVESDLPVVVGQLMILRGPNEFVTPVVYPISGTIRRLETVVDAQVSLVGTDELIDPDQDPQTTTSTSGD